MKARLRSVLRNGIAPTVVKNWDNFGDPVEECPQEDIIEPGDLVQPMVDLTICGEDRKSTV